MIYFILLVALSEYNESKRVQKESLLRKYIKKKFPKDIKWWDNSGSIDVEKEKKKTKVPDMFID